VNRKIKTEDELDALVWNGEDWVPQPKVPCDECVRNCRESVKAWNHFACRSGERILHGDDT